jgi:hypothetical protein
VLVFTETETSEPAAAELVRLAKEQGLSSTGSDGLLEHLTTAVLETSLSEEMTEHLGYEKHAPCDRQSSDSASWSATWSRVIRPVWIIHGDAVPT